MGILGLLALAEVGGTDEPTVYDGYDEYGGLAIEP